MKTIMKEKNKKIELENRRKMHEKYRESILSTINTLKSEFNNDWLDKKRENDLSYYKDELKKINQTINSINNTITSLDNIIKEKEKIEFIFAKENIQDINVNLDELTSLNENIILSNIGDKSIIYDEDNKYLVIKDDNMLINIDRDDLYNVNDTDEFNKQIGIVNFNEIRKKYKMFRLQFDSKNLYRSWNYVCKNGHVYIRMPAIVILNTVNSNSDFTTILNIFLNKK